MHSSEDLKQMARRTSNGQLKTRYLALHHFLRGETRTQIASYLGVARGSVNTWVTKFLNQGIEGLQDKPKPGRPHQLSTKQLEQLRKYIERHAVKPDGGRLIAEDVRSYIREAFHIEYRLRNVYRIMETLGFSWITSRSQHPKQQQGVQDAYKKLPAGNDP